MTYPAYNPGQPFEFQQPGFYSPGQAAFNNNPEMSQLITMAAGSILPMIAGPGQFLPHMSPTQHIMDQYALRRHQQQTRIAASQTAGAQTPDVTNLILGGMEAFTNEPMTDANRAHAANAAQMINSPIGRQLMGMAFGEENVEATLYGSRGNMGALGAAINRSGYFRRGAMGDTRMSGDEMANYTEDTFAQMYEPQGNIEHLTRWARSGDSGATQRLQKAAKMEDRRVVADDAVVKRIEDLGAERVNEIYGKYVEGTETDTAKQAQAIKEIRRAVKATGVVKEDETTIDTLKYEAEQMPTREMHGFRAGQMGQVLESLTQQGRLPKNLGAMTPAERVKAIAETNPDDETLDRLSQDMLRDDLMSRNDAEAVTFRSKTADEQADYLKERAEPKKNELKETMKAVRESAAGGTGAMSAEDVSKLGGFERLAGNVDAGRSTEALKGYADSLAVIKQIFGDSGNPNAPVPALMAVLEGLTQGSMASMDPAKVKSTLQQMQVAAKAAGVGIQQLQAMHAQMDARGQQLGVSPMATMQNLASTLAGMETMRNTGVLGGGGYGGYKNVNEAGAALGDAMQRGAASKNATAMAAMAQMYEENPDAFDPESEVAKAVAAYRDPNSDGTYTFKDPKTGKEVTRNLYETVGEGGVQAVQRMVVEGGGDVQGLDMRMLDARVQANVEGHAGYRTQRYELVQRTRDNVTTAMAGKATDGAAAMAGRTDADKHVINREVGEALAELALDTSHLGQEEQLVAMETQLEQKLVDKLTPQMGEAEARRMAKEFAGKDRLGSREVMGNVRAGTGAYYTQTSGGDAITKGAAVWGAQTVEGERAGAQAHRDRAARRAEVGLGAEDTPMGRISDYFREIGKTKEKFTVEGFMEALSPFVSDQEMLQRYAGDMSQGILGVQDDIATETDDHRKKLLNNVQTAMYTGENPDRLLEGVNSALELSGITGDKANTLRQAVMGRGQIAEDAILGAFGLSADQYAAGQKLSADEKTKNQREAERYMALNKSKEAQLRASGFDPATGQPVPAGAPGAAGSAGPSGAAGAAGPAGGAMAQIDSELATLTAKAEKNKGLFTNGLTKEETARRTELLAKREELAATAGKDVATAPSAAEQASPRDSADGKSSIDTLIATLERIFGGGGEGGSGESSLKLTGSLTLDGSFEQAVINATASRTSQTEGGAAPVVNDPPKTAASKK